MKRRHSCHVVAKPTVLATCIRLNLAFAALVICSTQAIATDSSKTHALSLKDLSIEIPADWEVLSDAETLLTARSPQEGPDDSFGENMRVESYALRKPARLEKILELQREDARLEWNIRGDGTLAGSKTPIVWLAISPKDPTRPGHELTKIDYTFIRDSDIIVVHCMVESSKYDQYRPVFESIVRTIVPVRSTTPSNTATNHQSIAREQGRIVGKVTFYAMLGVVVIAGIVLLFRRFAAKR